jgi:glycosyltransferase involved in cell wall biosynthesis
MRILHVSDGSIYNYDGVSTYINELLECSLNDGTDSKVLTSVPFNPDRPRKVNHNSEVKEFRRLSFLSADKFNFSLPAGMKKSIAGFAPDIIWIHTIGPLGLRAARVARKRYRIFYTKHCFDGDLWCSHLNVPTPFRWLFHMVAEAAESRILKYSEVAFLHLNRFDRLKSVKYFNRFRYIPPPISSKFLERGIENERYKEEKITIGFCGRLDAEKGIEKLFMAEEICRNKLNIKNIHLLLVGDGPEAKRLCNAYPGAETTVTGFVDDVIPLLDRMDAFVLPSETEMYSLSSLEAYSRGKMVFSTPVGYVGQNADSLSNVFLFRTAEELAALIKSKLIKGNIREKVSPHEMLNSVITFNTLLKMVKNSNYE